MRKILLLSAYDAKSHKRWRTGLEKQFPEYSWVQLHLPPRHFSWRIRGNSLSFALTHKEILSQSYDLLIATSMTDLSSLRGMVPELAKVPTILYFHENQFCYPRSNLQHASIEPQIVTLYSAICADQIVFNSDFNRSTFLSGVSQLLEKLPDHIPQGVVDGLESKSSILPVPLEDELISVKPPSSRRAPDSTKPVNILWNHRWEYDKGPDRLLKCVESLPVTLNIRFHILGQSFRRIPGEFTRLESVLEERGWLGKWGYVESIDEYRQLLASCQITLSTSMHDFQGLSVIEAALLGGFPLLPDREVYPEFFAAQHLYSSYPDDIEREAYELSVKIEKLVKEFSGGQLFPDLSGIEGLAWGSQKKCYENTFDSVIGTLL